MWKSGSLFCFLCAFSNADPTLFGTPYPFSQALERFSFGKSRIRDTVIAQNRILLFWYFTTYLLLEKNKPKYEPLQIPADDKEPIIKTEMLHSLQVEQIVEAPPVGQVDSNQPPESAGGDLVGPFVLEGL